MSELYEQIVSQRGSLEQLMARIPGFRGYFDRASRRTADRMLRDFVASEITQRINRMAALEKKLLDSGGMMLMARTKSARTKIQTYHDRVKAAPPGYSGFFAAVKIGPEELDRLYSFDEAQVRYLDRLDEVLNQFEAAIKDDGEVGEAIDAIDTAAAEANEAFNLREDVITNLDKSL
jgi:hypothetical protein